MEQMKIPFEFLPVPGFENWYEINALGTIRSFKKAKQFKSSKTKRHLQYLTSKVNNCGYLQLKLSKMGKTYTCYIHRLLALTFIPKPANKTEVNHIDGNKLNNSLDNLEWVSHAENMSHAFHAGLVKKRLKPVVDDSTGKIYSSVKEAAKDNKIEYKTLVNYLNGNRPNPTRLRYSRNGIIRRLRKFIGKQF